MAVTPAQRAAWQQRLQAEAASVAAREAEARRLAVAAASALQRHCPALEGVWLFGSLNDGRFSLTSDLDLAVAGLPAADLLAAMALLEPLQDTIVIDLVRVEDLPPHWQQRLRTRAEQLLPAQLLPPRP